MFGIVVSCCQASSQISECDMSAGSGTATRLDVITIGRCSVDLYGQQIGSRLAGFLHCIEGKAGGIRARLRCDHRRPGPLAPDLQLLDGRRAERIARRHDDRLALVAVQLTKLADGGRLASPITADQPDLVPGGQGD